jgi:outer membrane protein assembly factor BamD (BamD/ComL family)
MKLTCPFLFVCCFYLFLCLSFPVHSQNFNADNLLGFAQSLFREGDYLNAVHEYQRYLYLYPGTAQADFVQLHIAAAYQNMGRLDAAIEAYQSLIQNYPQSPFIPRAQSNVAQCQLLGGNQATSITSLRQFLSDYPESGLAPRAQFIIATIYMDKKDWTAAAQEWQQVQTKYSQTPFAEMSDQLIRIARQAESLPRRSPSTAGLLSTFFPGIGQIYSGHYSEGVYSLLIVGATAAGTAYYIDQERYEVAIPVGIIGLFFYINSIYDSWRYAKAFNHQHEDRLRDRLRKRIAESDLFSASEAPPTDIALLFLATRF